MEIINAEKLIEELVSAVALIDLDLSKEGTISNIIDRSARSTLMLLMSVIENSREEVFIGHLVEEIRGLKESVLRLQVEIVALKRPIRPI